MSNTVPHPDFFDLVGNVRAMRRLKPDPVPEELIMKVLNAGVMAASGQNLQPWEFVLMDDPEKKRWFADHYREAMHTRFGISPDDIRKGENKLSRALTAVLYQIDHMHETPYLLFVCGKRDWPFKVAEEDRVGLAPPNYGAVYPCVQNILLACRAVGLGAALTTMHQVFEGELHDYLNIPTDYGVVVTMPIGWPMGKFGPVTRKPAETKTHKNGWEHIL
ncbi:MAG: nitroreductase family protein [Pseudomonadales bacterium]|nr:nitroreductase family protein [Pseudomonadales bacterium]